jgi:hypothetical protein
MSGTFEYTAELQLNDGSLVQVDLEERGWAEPDRLANTRVFSLVPRQLGTGWPLIRINIPDGAKPVFKSRRNVLATAGQEFRAFAVGWFKDGSTHWTWVMPGGSIETETDDPHLVSKMTEALNQKWRTAVGAPGGDMAEGTN